MSNSYNVRLTLSSSYDEGNPIQYDRTELIEDICREVLGREEVSSVTIQDVNVAIRDDDRGYYA